MSKAARKERRRRVESGELDADADREWVPPPIATGSRPVGRERRAAAAAAAAAAAPAVAVKVPYRSILLARAEHAVAHSEATQGPSAHLLRSTLSCRASPAAPTRRDLSTRRRPSFMRTRGVPLAPGGVHAPRRRARTRRCRARTRPRAMAGAASRRRARSRRRSRARCAARSRRRRSRSGRIRSATAAARARRPRVWRARTRRRCSTRRRRRRQRSRSSRRGRGRRSSRA